MPIARLTKRIGTLGNAGTLRFRLALRRGFLEAVELSASASAYPALATLARLMGAVSQIVATAMMLTRHEEARIRRAYAYIKTEPVQWRYSAMNKLPASLLAGSRSVMTTAWYLASPWLP